MIDPMNRRFVDIIAIGTTRFVRPLRVSKIYNQRGRPFAVGPERTYPELSLIESDPSIGPVGAVVKEEDFDVRVLIDAGSGLAHRTTSRPGAFSTGARTRRGGEGYQPWELVAPDLPSVDPDSDIVFTR